MDEKQIKESLARLSTVMKNIDKTYGKHLMSFASEAKALDITFIPTGSFALDVECGGGIPEERITVFAGPESSCKTTMALKTIANAQRRYPYKPAALLDIEGTLDRDWAARLGVDLNRLLVIQPEYTEQAMDIADALIRSRGISLLVVDSLAAMLPAKELEKSLEEGVMGLAGALNSRFLRKATQALRYNRDLKTGNEDKVTVLIINQLREKMGVVKGNPEIQPGGRAIRFYMSMNVDFRQGDIKKIKVAGQEFSIGHEVKFTVKKNKVAAAKGTGKFDFYNRDYSNFRAGDIDRLKEIAVYAVLYDIIYKKGAWYHIEDKQFQGLVAALEYVRENEDIRIKIENEVFKAVASGDLLKRKAAKAEDTDSLEDDSEEVTAE